jgi:hypothetical protein
MPASSVPVIAGMTSTVIFVGSTLPMLGKALRTRDLGSYSLGNLVLANVGNTVHSFYVFSLPAGPVWALHLFNLVSTSLMLTWFLRYEWFTHRRPSPSGEDLLLDAADQAAGGGPPGPPP